MNSFQVVMANSNLETFLIFLLQQQQQQRRQQPQREHFGVPWHQWRPLLLRGRLQQNFVRERDIMMDNHLDNESDNEDDPTKLLDQWLGELNTLKKV